MPLSTRDRLSCGIEVTQGAGDFALRCADRGSQLAAFQNFLIMPATFLSGVFYSIHSLPPVWQTVSHFNPFFYMIDGFRYGFFGQSDVAPLLSFSIVAVFTIGLSALAIGMLKSGYKLRH